jgi:tellurite resistance protein TerC
MSTIQMTYIVFGIVIVVALVFDLGLLSKKHQTISIKTALYQTLLWVALSILFCGFLWWQDSSAAAVKYITAYLMEWSLSIDNIFVFILIFTFFKVQEKESGRALLIGILLAIIFRILFIALGIELINRFHWLLYAFGAFLLYTGFRLFFQNEDSEYDPGRSKVYKWAIKIFRVSPDEPNGRYLIRQEGRLFFTQLSLVVLMLAATDIIFALDSIPTVVSLVRDNPKVPFTSSDILVIYSSNIFAVLGLRSLFFLLKGAVNKFDFLQQGIAIVLAFIGVKMLIEYFDIHIPIFISLGVIVVCLGGSIIYSFFVDRKAAEEKESATEKNLTNT